MQWSDLWTALALVMIIEGIMPFISPASFKKYLQSMQDLNESSIRSFGLVFMISGLGLLLLIR